MHVLFGKSWRYTATGTCFNIQDTLAHLVKSNAQALIFELRPYLAASCACSAIRLPINNARDKFGKCTPVVLAITKRFAYLLDVHVTQNWQQHTLRIQVRTRGLNTLFVSMLWVWQILQLSDGNVALMLLRLTTFADIIPKGLRQLFFCCPSSFSFCCYLPSCRHLDVQSGHSDAVANFSAARANIKFQGKAEEANGTDFLKEKATWSNRFPIGRHFRLQKSHATQFLKVFTLPRDKWVA